VTDSDGTAPATGGQIPGPYDEVARRLVELPRPRAVRMSRQGKLWVTILLCAVALSVVAFLLASFATGSLAGSARPPASPRQVVPPIAIVAAALVFLWGMSGHERRLLIHGELAQGHVTECRAGQRGGAYVRYEFRTPGGESFSRYAADRSRKLSKSMSVPVFFDPHDPKKQVALCAAMYEFVSLSEADRRG
jgi:hypothetical protein